MSSEAPMEAASSPRKKKSLFSKPFRRPKPAEADTGKDEVEYFSRAKYLFPKQLEEEQRKKEEKQRQLAEEEKRQQSQRKRISESAERKASQTPEGKKRRISGRDEIHFLNSSPNHDEEDDDPSWQNRTPQKGESSRPGSAQVKTYGSPVTLSDRYSRDISKSREEAFTETAPTQVVTLTDSEDDDCFTTSFEKRAAQGLRLDDDDDDNKPHFSKDNKAKVLPECDPVMEEEFPELVRRARERKQALERQKVLDHQKAQSSFSKQNLGSPEVDDIFAEENTSVDHVVDILISSNIEESKPLLIKRKVSARLKEVRLMWIEKQPAGVIKVPQQHVFLTWKNKELFDVATCEHLGIKAGANGNLSTAHLDIKGRLHLEAWTRDMYEAHMRRLQQGVVEMEAEPEAEVEVVKMKLILKAKGMEPVKARLDINNPVGKLVQHFIRTYPEVDGKEIQLHFDGEILDHSTLLKNTELGEDGAIDTVEVHVR